MDGEHSLQLHSPMVPRLPAVLRVYVGCAARLYGEVETADLVKIHIQSGKLSLMTYDDFTEKPLPRLLERVKINLRTQLVQFFDYADDAPVQLLYNKSRYVSPDFEHYVQQQNLDSELSSLVGDTSGYGPDARTLLEVLERHRLKLNGFTLAPIDES